MKEENLLSWETVLGWEKAEVRSILAKILSILMVETVLGW